RACGANATRTTASVIDATLSATQRRLRIRVRSPQATEPAATSSRSIIEPFSASLIYCSLRLGKGRNGERSCSRPSSRICCRNRTDNCCDQAIVFQARSPCLRISRQQRIAEATEQQSVMRPIRFLGQREMLTDVGASPYTSRHKYCPE